MPPCPTKDTNEPPPYSLILWDSAWVNRQAIAFDTRAGQVDPDLSSTSSARLTTVRDALRRARFITLLGAQRMIHNRVNGIEKSRGWVITSPPSWIANISIRSIFGN